MKILKCEVGDGWHGACVSKLFNKNYSPREALIECISDYISNYGGDLNSWKLLTVELGDWIYNSGSFAYTELETIQE